jgi:molecular chaperone DnaK
MLRITETVSIPTIGGEIFTSELVEYVLQTFQDETGIDLRGPTHTAAIQVSLLLANETYPLQKLLNASEVAKCELSTSLLNEINLPFIAANESGPQNLIVKVSRAKLEAVRTVFSRVPTLP